MSRFGRQANAGKFTYLTSWVKGGLFMYYDGGHEGFSRYENGKIGMLTSLTKVNTCDYPYVLVHELRLLTASQRDYFTATLLPVLHVEYKRNRPFDKSHITTRSDITNELLTIDPKSWPTGYRQVEVALYQQLVQSRD